MFEVIFNGLMMGLAVMLMTTSTDPREVLFWALLAAERVCRLVGGRNDKTGQSV